MAQFKIDQIDNNLSVSTTGTEAKQATVWVREGEDFVDTKEPKFVDENKTVAVWNVQAMIFQIGEGRQLAKKIVIESATKPEVPLAQAVEAKGLRIDTNGRFFADSLHALGGQVAKFGDDVK